MKYTLISIALCAASTTAICQVESGIRAAWLPNVIGAQLAIHQANSSAPLRSLSKSDHGVFIGWHAWQTEALGLRLRHQVIAGVANDRFYAGIDATTQRLQTPFGSLGAALSITSTSGAVIHKNDVRNEPSIGQSINFTPIILPALRCPAVISAAISCEDIAIKTNPKKNQLATMQTGENSGASTNSRKRRLVANIALGVDFSPAFAPQMTLRLSYLHDAGVGSKAVHLTSRWSF